MKIGIIHLSDIHLKEKGNPILSKKNKIIDSIKNTVADFDKLFLVITGDIAFSGRKEEYLIAIQFVTYIKQEIEKYTKKETFLLGVPGNHDLNFDNSQKARELIIDGLRSQNFREIDEDLVQQCCLPQQNFFDFQDKVFLKDGEKVFKNELLRILDFEFENINIIFNCFNTSWTSKKSEQEKAIDYPVHIFSQEVYDNPATLRINLIHHPLNWQSKLSHREFRRFLNMNGDLTLSGHEHRADFTKMIDASDESNIFIESAALQESGNSQDSFFNLIMINLEHNEIAIDNYRFTNGKYSRHELLSKKGFLDYSRRVNIEQPINLGFANYLDSPSAQFLHKRASKLFIDDLFINPFLRSTDKKTDKIEIVEFNKILDITTLKKAILIGDELSGKTTLCKKVFKEFHNKGFLPVYFKGAAIEKPSFDYLFNHCIKAAFQDQYHKKAIEKFDEIDKDKLVLIIDDFNTCRMKDEYRNAFVKTVNENFERAIFSSSSLLYFNPITDGDGEFEDYQTYNIIELSYKLRYALIKKWNALGESAITGNNLQRKNEIYDQNIGSFLGKNFLPHYPFIIITALQSIDFGNSSDQGFSYYYKFLIEESLKKNIHKADNLQFYNFFLAEYCFFLFTERMETLSKDSFEEYFSNYVKIKRVSISFKEAYMQLQNSKVIREKCGFISISYPYIYYYYVSTYLSNCIEQPAIKDLINKMIERLYVDEYSNILIFLSQLSSNPYVVERLSQYSNEYFKDYSPASLSRDLDKINDLLKSIPGLVLVDDNSIEERRQQEIEKREKAEILDKEIDKQYISKDFDLNEDISKISLLNRFIRGIKTFEIFGQVIKKNWGAYDGIKKEEYVKSTFDLSMKVLTAYLTHINKNTKDLVDYIYYVADKREIREKSELEQLAKSLIFNLTYVASHGIIKRVSKSISHQQLKGTFNDVISKNPTNAYKLINLSITLDYFGHLPTMDIKNLLEKDKEFKGYYLPKLLLRNFVYQYLHLYEVPYEERNKICSIVGIEIKNQRQIQGGSKEKK